MGTSVGGNDADLMKHFNEDHDHAWSLNDLIRWIVARRKHRRPGVLIDAAGSEHDILDLVVLRSFCAPRSCSFGCSLLTLGSNGRKLSIRRIDNHRRSQIVCKPRLAAIETELREVIMHVGHGAGCSLFCFTLGS